MKKIAISMRSGNSSSYHEERDLISNDMIRFLEELRIVPLLIPNNLLNIDRYLDSYNIEGLILTGGNNISPKRYGASIDMKDVFLNRDETEEKMLDYAFYNKLPVLGICRGFQFLNVYLGGTLKHNIENHVNTEHKLKSKVSLYKDLKVNSFHNSGIDKENIADRLTILAYSEDGFVEAFENKELNVLGFQWHPERQKSTIDKKIIKSHFKL